MKNSLSLLKKSTQADFEKTAQLIKSVQSFFSQQSAPVVYLRDGSLSQKRISIVHRKKWCKELQKGRWDLGYIGTRCAIAYEGAARCVPHKLPKFIGNNLVSYDFFGIQNPVNKDEWLFTLTLSKPIQVTLSPGKQLDAEAVRKGYVIGALSHTTKTLD